MIRVLVASSCTQLRCASDSFLISFPLQPVSEWVRVCGLSIVLVHVSDEMLYLKSDDLVIELLHTVSEWVSNLQMRYSLNTYNIEIRFHDLMYPMQSLPHTHTHTYIYIYIYICVWSYMFMHKHIKRNPKITS